MEYLASVFSYLLVLAALIYLFWGSYIIRLNPRLRTNQVYLLLCISLSIWSFGLSVANTATSLNSVLMWRRFSALGWTTIYSITLHFFLLLTRNGEEKRRKKGLLLLYIPAFINTYIFSISTKLSEGQYNLAKTDLGWTNISINNGYDWFSIAIISYLPLSAWLFFGSGEINLRIEKQKNKLVLFS